MRSIVIAATVLLACTTAAAAQDVPTIQITNGGLVADADGAVEVSLKSQKFSVGASVHYASGRLDPYFCRDSADCSPGTIQSLEASWTGSDFDAWVNIGKESFGTGIGGSTDVGYGEVRFYGLWIAPDFDGRTTRKVVVPFAFEGSVSTPLVAAPEGGDTNTSYLLTGFGKATIQLVWREDPEYGGHWDFVSARYQFTRK